MKVHIPIKIWRRRSKNQKRLRALFRQRIKKYKRLAKIPNNKNDKIEKEIHDIDKEIQETFQKIAEQEEKRSLENIKQNRKYFFTFAKRKCNRVARIGPIKDDKENYIEDSKKISEILNNQFTRVFTEPMEEYKIENAEEFFQEKESEKMNTFLEDFQFQKGT